MHVYITIFLWVIHSFVFLLFHSSSQFLLDFLCVRKSYQNFYFTYLNHSFFSDYSSASHLFFWLNNIKDVIGITVPVFLRIFFSDDSYMQFFFTSKHHLHSTLFISYLNFNNFMGKKLIFIFSNFIFFFQLNFF